LSELGAGFQLAARDMEIRGIGNMLGHNQSGHIASIGFDLYTKLMEDTVKNIKGEKVGNNFIEPEINLQIKGYIPKDYITDLNQRLDVYRRLQLLDTLDDCSAIKNELIDRYGVFSTPIDKLMELVQVKVLCKQLHISKVCIVENEARINMVSSTPVSPEKLIMLVDKRMRFLSEFCLGIKLNRKNWANDLLVINDYLKKIIGLI
jgi:transcription-repair coupling factor (superfamily II helicase)